MHKRLYYAQEIILCTRDYVMHKRLCYVQEIILCTRDYVMYKRLYYRYIINIIYNLPGLQ